MNIIFLAHPTFEGHQSMPRFAKMLSNGMRARGHAVDIWSPRPYFHKLSNNASIQKWLGYLDQYLLFPKQIRQQSSQLPDDTLFVFTDQALGMWVPTLADRNHVIHCHDFLALRSALNEIPENTTSSSGKLYQRLILRGLQKGKNFVCVSQNTKRDLLRFINRKSINAFVVYNGFHQPFYPIPKQQARAELSQLVKIDLNKGYLLHIGGNHWYKNRKGVIEIYDAWRMKTARRLALIMVGEAPDTTLQRRQKESRFSTDIHWLSNVSDDAIRLAYAGASVFVFPSLGEGFGWPIAEAMASGTAVVVTDEPPMTEVAGDAGFLIPRMPKESGQVASWSDAAADVVENILNLGSESAAEVSARGTENTRRFDTQQTIDEIEKIYERIIAQRI